MTATIDPRIRERRIEVQREAGRKRLRITLLVVFALVAVGLVYLTVESPALDVDHVRVKGVQNADTAQVLDAAHVAIGAPLLRVDKGAVRARIEALPWVEKADVASKLPGTLSITVHERVPVAYARRDDAHVAVLDANGHVITDLPAPLAGLVEVRGVAKVPAAGGTLQPSGAAGVVLALPPELAARVGAIDVSDDAVKLVLSAGGEVRLCTPADLAAKGAAALAVIDRLGATPAAYIDVCVPSSPVAGGVPGA
jgi:cell division protein FtsQ